jgi:hypothetical protein
VSGSFEYDAVGRRRLRTVGSNAGTGVLSYLTDILGSPIALADGSGAVQTVYAYEAFGTVTTTGATSGDPLNHSMTFTHDSEARRETGVTTGPTSRKLE